MKKLLKRLLRKRPVVVKKEIDRNLEKKAIEGAEKAVREYRRVFERLAEFDRA